MRNVTVELVDAFIDGAAGGNPAGIVFEGGADLSVAQRQEVARHVAVSETAFVLPADDADYRLEFYTPTRPIPHCGHATVATFARLAQMGCLARDEIVNQTVDGPRRIRIRGSQAFLEQVAAEVTSLDEGARRDVLASLGIVEGQLLAGTAAFLADNGNRSIQIGIADTGVLGAIRPDLKRIEEISNWFQAVCYYVFSLNPVVPGRDATARMFGPAYGIPEEAATGMASGALACWLDSRLGGQREELILEQGHFMTPASPSLIVAKPQRQGDKLATMWVGGSARVKGTRQIQV